MENSSVAELARKGTFANRIETEQSEAVAWMNQHLLANGQSDKLLTDLAGGIADGITLLRVVEAVAREPLPKYNANPSLRVQKQENMQICLQFLKMKGLALKGIHAEDLVGGNLKSILSLFYLLKQHFSGPSAPPKDPAHNLKRSPSPPTEPTMLKNDSVLAWISDRVNTPISSYASLRDGRTLCVLANTLRSTAIPYELIENGSSEDRLKAFVVAMERHLGVKGGDLKVQRIADGRGDDALRPYMGQCMAMWQQLRDQKRNDQALMMAVRATVKRLSVPTGTEASTVPPPTDSASQKQRTNDRMQPASAIPGQTTPTIPSITVAPAVEDTPNSKTTPRPDKISRSESLGLPDHQVRVPFHNEMRHRRGHSEVSAVSTKEVWSAPSNHVDDVLVPKDYETEMDQLGSYSSSCVSSPSGSTRGFRAPLSPSESNNRQIRSSSERTKDVHSPLERTRDVHSPSERSRDVRSPSERSRDVHSPSERTRNVHSPSERTRNVHSTSESTRDVYSPSEKSRSNISVGATNGSSYNGPEASDSLSSSHLPKNQSGGHDSNNLTTAGSRTTVGTNHTLSHENMELSNINPSESHASNFGTLPDRNKHRTEEQLFPIARRTFSSPESLAVHEAAESDIPTDPSKPSRTHVSPLKRSQSQLASAGSKINTSTIFVDRPQRSSSTTRLDYTGEVSSKIDDLHERVTMLAAVMDSERQSLLKQFNNTVIKERAKRKALERRVLQMETSAQKLHKHYSQCFLQLASQISVLKAQIEGRPGDQNSDITRAPIEKEDGEEEEEFGGLQRQKQHGHQNIDSNTDNNEVTANETTEKEVVFFKQGTRPVPAKSEGPFFRGSEASFRKLNSFFGEQPPRLLTTKDFLQSLNYEDLYERFKNNRITLAELKHLEEQTLEQLGIPLGPRLRILAEVKTLVQCSREHVECEDETLL